MYHIVTQPPQMKLTAPSFSTFSTFTTRLREIRIKSPSAQKAPLCWVVFMHCRDRLSLWEAVKSIKQEIFFENFVWFSILSRGSVVVIMGAFYLHASFPRLAWTYFDRGGVMANCCFAASNWQFRICGFDSRKQAKVITDNGLTKIQIKGLDIGRAYLKGATSIANLNLSETL